MTDLFEKSLGYGVMNPIRSALSQVLYNSTGVTFGGLKIVRVSQRSFPTKTHFTKIHYELGPVYVVKLLEDFVSN